MIDGEKIYVVNPSTAWDVSSIDKGNIIKQKVVFRSSPYLSLAVYRRNYYEDLFEGYSYRSPVIKSAKVKYFDGSMLDGVIVDAITSSKYVNIFLTDVISLKHFIYLSKLCPFKDFDFSFKNAYSLEEIKVFYDMLRQDSLPRKRKTKKYKIQKPASQHSFIYGFSFNTTPTYAGTRDDHVKCFQRAIKENNRNNGERFRK